MTACINHSCKGYGLGYATAWVTRNGKKCPTTLHRKVYFAHTGDWPEVVRHTCDNPRCINPEHLVGGTQLNNMQDCKQRGRIGDCRNFGTANGRTVYTDDDVLELRLVVKCLTKTYGLNAELARQYNMKRTQFERIIRGQQRV